MLDELSDDCLSGGRNPRHDFGPEWATRVIVYAMGPSPLT